jgi:hypothetical protein
MAGMTEYHKLVSDRYFDVTPQARRVPVAVVLIVDPAHVTRVETAFANSPLRFLINQVLINRYPRSVRPDTSSDTVVAESSGSGPGGYPLAPMMPSFGGRYPGGPGRYADDVAADVPERRQAAHADDARDGRYDRLGLPRDGGLRFSRHVRPRLRPVALAGRQ